MRGAYVTLVSNAEYALGALALARSLNRIGAQAPLIVMSTRDDLDLDELLAERCEIRFVDRLPLSTSFNAQHSREAQHDAAPFTKGKKPSFHDPLDNFCKLRLWEFTEFERVVFLDADTIVLRDIDKLFRYPQFAAAPNLYETLEDMHRLNSGVFVAEPSRATFDDMLTKLETPGKFWKRTDQTFLEAYFPDWHGLPYVFNALQYIYFNLPALWRWSSIRVVHYQYEKPWESDHDKIAKLRPLIDLWYAILEKKELPEPLDLIGSSQ